MIMNNVKTANQIQVQDANGNPVVPVVGSNGGMLVEMATGEIKVAKENTTLASAYVTVGTTATQVSVTADKVTGISVANYSEEATLTITVGTVSYVVGPNLALDIPINKSGISSISFTASAADTKVQYIIKGVEADD